MATEKFIVNGKEVSVCRRDCEHSSDDGGGPGTVMCCDHPRVADFFNNDHLGRGVILHPVCDSGIPEKCPLRRLPSIRPESP